MNNYALLPRPAVWIFPDIFFLLGIKLNQASERSLLVETFRKHSALLSSTQIHLKQLES